MSDAHHKALIRNLGGDDRHTKVPTNPARVIGASTQDVLDEPDPYEAAVVARRAAVAASQGN